MINWANTTQNEDMIADKKPITPKRSKLYLRHVI